MDTHEVERVKEELRAAVERVHMLEAALWQRNNLIQSTFKLPPSLANVLGLLLSLPVVEIDLICRHAGVGAKVAIHRLRRAIDPWGLEVRSRRRTGYWLDDIDKMKIREMLMGCADPVEEC